MNFRSSLGRGLQLMGIGTTGLAALMFLSPRVGMWPLLYMSVVGVLLFAAGLWVEGRRRF